MKCCGNCFGDRHISRQLIPSISTEVGQCSFCGSGNQALVDPAALRDAFELVAAAYTQNDEGSAILRWLREDWDLFRSLNDARATALLARIFGDQVSVDRRVVPKALDMPRATEAWEGFRAELMYENRFFPQKILDLDRLRELLGHLLVDAADIPQMWHRARLEIDDQGFAAADMGAPPRGKPSHGRANPPGIPYLYLASTAVTAVSEVRPHTGEKATVATFTVPGNLKLVDLVHPKRTVSPFLLEDEVQVSRMRNDINLLLRLGEELTRPVLPQAAMIEYAPTQYLCEFIKRSGYDGLMYRSSVADGINMALFNPLLAVVGAVTHHRISRVTVEIQ